MKRFIWFSVFTCLGVFLIIDVAFPELSTRKALALVLGIQFMSSALDFLDHIKKED